MFGLFRKKKERGAEPEKKVSTPPEKRVYVFDFDRTITIQHTGAIAYGNELRTDFIQKNIKKGFADFVHRVISNGHGVYIASYSDDANVDLVEEEAVSGHDLIKLYMDQVFGQDQDPQRRTYGIWPYHYEEPLDAMNKPDWNWADFIGVQLLQLAHRTGLTIQPKHAPCENILRRRQDRFAQGAKLITSVLNLKKRLPHGGFKMRDMSAYSLPCASQILYSMA